MRKLLVALLLAPVGIYSVAALHAQQSKPARANIQDSHEGVSITLEPWTLSHQYKERFPKKTPFQGGIIAIHIVAKNDNDIAVTLNRSRVRLLVQIDEDHRQELESLAADDVADTVLLKQNGKDPTARRVPLPIPQIGSGVKSQHDKNWTEFRDTVQNNGLPSNVIAAHGSVEGLLYFDLRGEIELLQNARLYVPDLQKMGSKEAISYFDIPFSAQAASE
jgi:hypothetical protein